MPEEIATHSRLRYVNEVLFAVYLCLLLIMANAVRSILHPSVNSWVFSLFLVTSGPRNPSSYEDQGLRFAFLLLWVASAALVFLCLRLLSQFSSVRAVFRILHGIVAVAGFPIAAAYTSFRGYYHMFGLPTAFLYAYVPHRWLGLEVLASLAGVFLFVFAIWPKKTKWALLLLFLHFALWSWVVILGAGSGHILLWPGYSWMPLTRQYPSLLYPFLGLLASIVWALDVRQPNPNHKSTPAPAAT